jgi:transcriptional regulator with XRE-family HTH domain
VSEQDVASEKRGVRCPNVQRLFDRYRPGRSLASLAREYGVSEDTLKRYRRHDGTSAFTRPPTRDVIEMYARVLGCPQYEVAGAFFLDFYPVIEAGPIERVNLLLALVTEMKSPAQVEELIRYAREIVASGHGESRAEPPRI